MEIVLKVTLVFKKNLVLSALGNCYLNLLYLKKLSFNMVNMTAACVWIIQVQNTVFGMTNIYSTSVVKKVHTQVIKNHGCQKWNIKSLSDLAMQLPMIHSLSAPLVISYCPLVISNTCASDAWSKHARNLANYFLHSAWYNVFAHQ